MTNTIRKEPEITPSLVSSDQDRFEGTLKYLDNIGFDSYISHFIELYFQGLCQRVNTGLSYFHDSKTRLEYELAWD